MEQIRLCHHSPISVPVNVASPGTTSKTTNVKCQP